MCDDKETTRKEKYECVNKCDGYCSGSNEDLIPVNMTLQYRSFKYHYPDTLITHYFCKRHYEWMLTINNGKPLSSIQGKDEYDALECFHYTNNYDFVYGRSTIFTFMREKEKDNGSNKYNRKVILVNECIEHLKFKEYEALSVFHFNRGQFIELIPLSYELADFFKQNDFFYFKLNAEENCMSRIHFHINNNSAVNCSVNTDVDINYDNCDVNDKLYFDTLYSFLEKRNDFEDMYWFMEDTMNELSQFYKVNKDKEFTFRYMLMLEDALSNPDNTINLLTMLKQGQITSELLWITYVKHNHYHNHSNPIQLKDNKMLISLIIDTFSKDELKLFLQYAIEGRRTSITYRMRDFYNYIHPNLTVVKIIVPKYIDYMEEILCDFQINTSDENDGKDEKVRRPLGFNVMLDFWNKSENYTMSYYPDRGEEHHYYDKDESIREYLESLSK